MLEVVFWNALRDRAEFYPSALYAPEAMRYYEVTHGAGLYRDRSFAVADNGRLLLVCIMTERNASDGDCAVDAFGIPGTAWQMPGCSSSAAEAQKLCRNEMAERLKEYPSARIRFCEYASAPGGAALAMLDDGARVETRFDVIVDLELPVQELRRRLRKSYKALVNRSVATMPPCVLGPNECSWEDMLEFRELHAREAGRVTRSESSWRQQYKAVRAERAFLIFARQGRELVGASYYMHDGRTCHYGSGAYKRALFPFPVSHGNLWTAITHAKSLGLSLFDVGEAYPNCSGGGSEKESAIGYFKRGFGGVVVPRMIFIR